MTALEERSGLPTPTKATLRRRRSRGAVQKLLWPTATFLVLIMLWQLVITLFGVPLFLVPSPYEVAKTITSEWALLVSQTWPTVQEILIGFGVSMAIGIPVGVVLAEVPRVRQMFYPFIVLMQILPKLAFGPLLLVWFGFGLMPKVSMVVLISFFPIILDTMTGVENASSDFRALARSLGFSPVATFFKITLPQAVPNIFAGLKVAITLSVVGAVVAEFIGAQAGLGYLILVAQGQLKTPLLFAALVFLTAVGLILYGLIALIERVLFPWSRPLKEHKHAF